MVGWLWNSALLTQCVPFWKDCELAPLCKNTKNTYWPTRISWDGIGLLFLGCLWRSCIDVCIYWGVSSSVHVSNSLFTITCVQLLTFALVNPFIRILVCMFLWVYSYNRASTLDYISIYIYANIHVYTCIITYLCLSTYSYTWTLLLSAWVGVFCPRYLAIIEQRTNELLKMYDSLKQDMMSAMGYDLFFFSRFWPSNSGE